MMLQIHLFISGLVQGVGYRSWVVRIARKMSLSGRVKNLPDGRVEIVAEGDEKTLRKFIYSCRRGPPTATVSQVVEERIPATGEFNGFMVVY